MLVYVDHHTIYGISQKDKNTFHTKFCQFNFHNSVVYTNVQSPCKNIIFAVYFFLIFQMHANLQNMGNFIHSKKVDVFGVCLCTGNYVSFFGQGFIT